MPPDDVRAANEDPGKFKLQNKNLTVLNFLGADITPAQAAVIQRALRAIRQQEGEEEEEEDVEEEEVVEEDVEEEEERGEREEEVVEEDIEEEEERGEREEEEEEGGGQVEVPLAEEAALGGGEPSQTRLVSFFYLFIFIFFFFFFFFFFLFN
jgi:hypothetical protein